MVTNDSARIAAEREAVRQASLRAAIEAYEDAGIQGLCAEGRWEAALAAIRKLDLRAEIDVLDHDNAELT